MKYLTSAEYDKMISDDIEDTLIDNEALDEIDTMTILRHLLGRIDDYDRDACNTLLLGKYYNFYDENGILYKVKFVKD